MSDIEQAGAIPFRVRKRGTEVLLVTSSSGRWIFPKGTIDPGETAIEAAKRELYEEAGVEGRWNPDPIGRVELDPSGTGLVVFACEVETVHVSWPEVDRRDRVWAVIREARAMIDGAPIEQLLRRFERARKSA